MTELQTLFGSMEILEKPKPRSVCGCYVSECRCKKQAAIERHYLSGKSLTVLDAVKLFHTIDLRKYNCILRNKGLNIVGTWVQNGKSSYKNYKIEKFKPCGEGGNICKCKSEAECGYLTNKL